MFLSVGGLAGGGSIPWDFYKPGPSRKSARIVFGIDVTVVYCIPTLFVAWAYYDLFTSPDISKTGATFSLVATLILVTIGMMQFFGPEAE